MHTLIALARAAASSWPDKVLLHFDGTGETLTFAEFDRQTDAIADTLARHGIRKGDRVLVASANRALFPLAWFGILKSGAVMVPINTAYRLQDARHIVNLAEPKAAFSDADRIPLIQALTAETPSLAVFISSGAPESGWLTLASASAGDNAQLPSVSVEPEDLANIQFTSGSSGFPKGCMLTHRYWMVLAQAVRDAVIALGTDDVMLTAQAFSYLDPQWALVLTLMSGSRLVVLERFRPSILWDKIVEHDVSFFYCLAAMPLMLLSSPVTAAERRHRLRLIMCSAIPLDRHAELEERFGVPWLEAYGSTETGSDLGIGLADHDRTCGTGTIGMPLAHREACIVDDAFRPLSDSAEGELLIRGAGMMLGYWRNPEGTAEAFHDGWYRTGDIARRDVDGFYYLVGRRKDMIRRAGENIAAAEVEGVLQQHPAVTIAACVAVPDPVRNEEVRVFIVPRGEVSVAELLDFLGPRLARFKIPRYWSFVPSLPMTPSERVAKPMLPRELDRETIDAALLSAGP